jgi:nuclear pore complex protein Nup93
VARNVGNLLLWSIMCLGKQREAIRSKGFRAGSDEHAVEGLLQAAKDLMVFAGLIRYKLSPEVMDVLARAGQMVEGV